MTTYKYFRIKWMQNSHAKLLILHDRRKGRFLDERSHNFAAPTVKSSVFGGLLNAER
jgi:hypothetical protein